MSKIAIVYHSGFGHTARQANAVREGVESAGGNALFITADEALERWGDLETCDGIIFGCPTYMGGPSAPFKAFMDASSQPVFAAGLKWRDKVAAGFTNSGSNSGDKLSTLFQLMVFAAQQGMHWVNLGLPPAAMGPPAGEPLNRNGFFVGAAAQSNFDEGPDTAPPEGDLKTARFLGARVTQVAERLAGLST